MQNWRLEDLLDALHDDVHSRLREGRTALKNPVTKGNASEKTWIKMLRRYLPKRYRVSSAHVVDSEGNFSEQIDAVIFDRQYTPPIFSFEGQLVVPAESVYAVFEIKQDVRKSHIGYAQKKIESVRKLHRTSAQVVHSDGVHFPKKLFPIIGGLLTLESQWTTGSLESHLGPVLKKHGKDNAMHLDIGCIAAHGCFVSDAQGNYSFVDGQASATAFLFSLISILQEKGTAPVIDINAYAKWLKVL